MAQILTLLGRLPGRNESERWARSHWSVGAKKKKQHTQWVALECKRQKIDPVNGKATVTVRFYEQDMRRDADNVMGGLKYLLDGMVQAGVIPDDRRKNIDLIVHPVGTDRGNPRVEVEIQ